MLLRKTTLNLWSKTEGNGLKLFSAFIRHKSDVENNDFSDVHRAAQEKDTPIEMENPFVKEKPKCVLCEHNIEPDFRNVRLLSQFVSRFTGRVYGRHIVGLCEHKYNKVVIEIQKAQKSGLMAVMAKNPKYYNDPSLYNPAKPIKPHPY